MVVGLSVYMSPKFQDPLSASVLAQLLSSANCQGSYRFASSGKIEHNEFYSCSRGAELLHQSRAPSNSSIVNASANQPNFVDLSPSVTQY
jgi:hypothetical protein